MTRAIDPDDVLRKPTFTGGKVYTMTDATAAPHWGAIELHVDPPITNLGLFTGPMFTPRRRRFRCISARPKLISRLQMLRLAQAREAVATLTIQRQYGRHPQDVCRWTFRNGLTDMRIWRFLGHDRGAQGVIDRRRAKRVQRHMTGHRKKSTQRG